MDLTGCGVCVFCSSSNDAHPDYRVAAVDLGTAIARAGATRVYGGASVGLMGALADAALDAGGSVVGVIPDRLVRRELAHGRVTELIHVDTMHERKSIMSQRCAAYVALPGGVGTWDELFEVVTWRQLGMHARPIIVVNTRGFYDPLRAQIERAIEDGVIRPAYRSLLAFAPSVDETMTLLAASAEPEGADLSFT